MFYGCFCEGNEFACMEWNGMDMYDVKNEKYIYIYMYISLMYVLRAKGIKITIREKISPPSL